MFVDNLRKQGDRIKYKNDLPLTEDEKLTPSFENAIVLWSLEKIDPRLPAKVKKEYGHQMTGDMTLRDLQPVIFENIKDLIDDLDQNQTAKAFASQVLDDGQPFLNAVASSNRNNTRSFRPSTFKPRNLSYQSQKPQPQRNQFLKKPTITDKFCRICNLAGSDPRIYTSHEIGNCSRLTIRDMEFLKNALVLNGMITIPDEDLAEPEYVLQPGWDDDEALQYQQTADTE